MWCWTPTYVHYLYIMYEAVHKDRHTRRWILYLETTSARCAPLSVNCIVDLTYASVHMHDENPLSHLQARPARGLLRNPTPTFWFVTESCNTIFLFRTRLNGQDKREKSIWNQILQKKMQQNVKLSSFSFLVPNRYFKLGNCYDISYTYPEKLQNSRWINLTYFNVYLAVC